ncbi:MAG: hypothetical protein ACI87E_004505, partial [Mariniblastus sp.]
MENAKPSYFGLLLDPPDDRLETHFESLRRFLAPTVDRVNF